MCSCVYVLLEYYCVVLSCVRVYWCLHLMYISSYMLLQVVVVAGVIVYHDEIT